VEEIQEVKLSMTSVLSGENPLNQLYRQYFNSIFDDKLTQKLLILSRA